MQTFTPLWCAADIKISRAPPRPPETTQKSIRHCGRLLPPLGQTLPFYDNSSLDEPSRTWLMAKTRGAGVCAGWGIVMAEISDASADVLARLLLSRPSEEAIRAATLLRDEALVSDTPERAALWERVLVAIARLSQN